MPLRQVPVLEPAWAGSDQAARAPPKARTDKPAFKARTIDMPSSNGRFLQDKLLQPSSVPGWGKQKCPARTPTTGTREPLARMAPSHEGPDDAPVADPRPARAWAEPAPRLHQVLEPNAMGQEGREPELR